MTSVYNLLREACGISQAEAAEHVHETRLDTVKSWSSDRRPAPDWAINQLQSLSRRIRRSGEDYAAMVRKTAQGNVYIIGTPHNDQDSHTCGFPSSAAHHQAIAVAISLLPDDAEIRLTPRIRGAVPAPVLERELVLPTGTDRDVLASMRFVDGRCLTEGNMNRRKFERLEDIGWIKGLPTNLSGVEYHLTRAGSFELALIRRGKLMLAHPPTTGFQSQVRVGPSPLPPIFLRIGEQVFLDREHVFMVTKIDGEVVTVHLPNEGEILLSAPVHMLG